MSYVPVPASGASIPATDGPQILANFQSIQTAFDINHVDFNDANAGKHKFITFPVQTSAPVIAAGDIGVFSENSALTTQNELFITNSVGTTYPVTASLPATSGWCYLPSGLLMKWGVNAGNGDTVIPFPVAATIPVFNNVYTTQVCDTFNSAADTDTYVRHTSTSTVTIRVFCSARTTTGAAATSFNWLVIGD